MSVHVYLNLLNELRKNICNCNRIKHSCSCIIEFIKVISKKKDAIFDKPCNVSVFATSLIHSNIFEHEY